MPQVIEKTVYTFEELSDDAKERARDWWRGCESSDFDPDFVFEDVETCAKMLGIEFRTKPVKLMGGGTRYDSVIYYSGFSSQGDGACFEGDYSYAKGAGKAIRDHAPADKELHRIADELQALQRKAFYGLTASMRHSGRYYHSGCMYATIDHATNENRITAQIEDSLIELMRDFANWIYRQLEKEYEYRMSDENVNESIKANEYQFDENGNIH